MARLDDQQLIMDYLNDLELKGVTAKTIENYHSCLRLYHRWLQKNDMRIISVNDKSDKEIIKDFLRYLRNEYVGPQGKSISYARIKVIFTALNNLYDYLELEDIVDYNIVLKIRKRYLQQFKNGYVPAERKVISVEEMGRFINSIVSPRDKAIVTVFVKTGVRRGELIAMDIDDVDLTEQVIRLKTRKFKKRSAGVVFFDEETKPVLQRWFKRREYVVEDGETALFVGDYGRRITRNVVYDSVVNWAERLGIHNRGSDRLEDHFSPHNLRHCFTTYLKRTTMPKEHIQELRGDKRAEVIDIYNHIELDDIKRTYLSCMPRFNIM